MPFFLAAASFLIAASPPWPPIAEAQDIAALEHNSMKSGCYVRRTGGLMCWGYPVGRRFSQGTTEPYPGPVPMPALADAAQLGQRMGASICAITRSKRIKCLDADQAVDIGVSGAVQFEGGRLEGCARLEDGGVSCWGTDYGCGLGPRPDAKGCTSQTLPPRRVPGVDQVVWVSHRAQGTCAVRADGMTLCWGQYQPFGVGARGPAELARPTPIASLPPLVRIELLLQGAVGVDRAGALQVWRRRDTSQPALPFPLPGQAPQRVVELAAEEDYALAVTSDGRAWLVGAGPLDWSAGNHARRTWNDPPLALPGISDAIRASAAVNHGCVLTRRGAIQCLGSNSVGQLGDATLQSRFTDTTSVVQLTPDKVPVPNTCTASDALRASCLKAGPFCDLEPSPLLQKRWCSGATPPPDWRPPPIPKSSPCLCTCSQEFRAAQAAMLEQARQCSMIP